MSWTAFAAAAPDLAAQVHERLTTHKHHTLATLRRDGSPRISGTECAFDGDVLWIGSMWQARKALDLLRDPRYALHSHSEDPPAWPGDAKVSGTAVAAADFEHLGEPSHRFELQVVEASFTRVEGEELVITWWTRDGGVRTRRRT